MTKKTTSRRTRRAEPARGAKVVTGTATAIAFVGIVTGLQAAAAAQDAAQARLQLTSELAARDALVAQSHATAVERALIAQKAASKAAADKREAAAKKAAAARRTQLSAPVGGAPAAPRAAAPRTVNKPAAKPVNGTSGGSGG